MYEPNGPQALNIGDVLMLATVMAFLLLVLWLG